MKAAPFIQVRFEMRYFYIYHVVLVHSSTVCFSSVLNATDFHTVVKELELVAITSTATHLTHRNVL